MFWSPKLLGASELQFYIEEVYRHPHTRPCTVEAQQAVLQQQGPLPGYAKVATVDCNLPALVMLTLVLTILQVFNREGSCSHRAGVGYRLGTPDFYAMFSLFFSATTALSTIRSQTVLKPISPEQTAKCQWETCLLQCYTAKLFCQRQQWSMARLTPFVGLCANPIRLY